jgi:hypothetical protein
MPTRRILKSVLHNFLGTYTSRYSDYGGYWLFGFLTPDLQRIEFDLLANTAGACNSPVEFARNLAGKTFSDQLQKSGIAIDIIGEALLRIEKLPGVVAGLVNGQTSDGHSVRFLAIAKVDTGRIFERERVIFVADHDQRKEIRSTRSSCELSP